MFRLIGLKYATTPCIGAALGAITCSPAVYVSQYTVADLLKVLTACCVLLHISDMANLAPEDERCMPLTCDGCEASARSGLLAVTMYELMADSTRVGQVSRLVIAHTRVYSTCAHARNVDSFCSADSDV